MFLEYNFEKIIAILEINTLKFFEKKNFRVNVKIPKFRTKNQLDG